MITFHNKDTVLAGCTLFDATMAACKRDISLRVSVTSKLVKVIMEKKGNCDDAYCFFDMLYEYVDYFLDLYINNSCMDRYVYTYPLCEYNKVVAEDNVVCSICVSTDRSDVFHFVMSVC